MNSLSLWPRGGQRCASSPSGFVYGLTSTALSIASACNPQDEGFSVQELSRRRCSGSEASCSLTLRPCCPSSYRWTDACRPDNHPRTGVHADGSPHLHTHPRGSPTPPSRVPSFS